MFRTRAKSTLDGEKSRGPAPREAQSAGIHVIYQELVLFPELTVAENVFINDQPLTRFGIIDYRRWSVARTMCFAGWAPRSTCAEG